MKLFSAASALYRGTRMCTGTDITSIPAGVNIPFAEQSLKDHCEMEIVKGQDEDPRGPHLLGNQLCQ